MALNKCVCVCVYGIGKMPDGIGITGGSHLPPLVAVDRMKVLFIFHLKI